jgi:hypothetical protein
MRDDQVQQTTLRVAVVLAFNACNEREGLMHSSES